MSELGKQIAVTLGDELQRQAIGLDDLIDVLQEPITNVLLWMADADSMPLSVLAKIGSLLSLLPSSMV